MKVLLCLCACIAAASAGVISYPVAPLSYHGNYIFNPPLVYNTFPRPFDITYTGVHGYPIALGPSYFSYNLLPGNVVFPGVPGLVHYLPVEPPAGKGKPDKKKPGDKKDDKDSKEETTEEPKKEEGESKETEELAQ